MEILLFQARQYPPPKDKKDNPPVFSGAPKGWLGSGTYFWESFVDNAKQWGKKHYHNNYKISQKKYTYSTENCLNLVDDFNVLSTMKSFYEGIKAINPNATPKYLYTLLKLFRKASSTANKQYECARLLPYGGLRPQLRLDCSDDKSFTGEFYFTPPIQVCFWRYTQVNVNDIDGEACYA